MWANFGPTVQVKHLTLNEDLASTIIDQVESDHIVTDLGFLALAFIAGLNVDKFIAKVEDIAQASWGIEKSRAGKEEKK